MKYDDWYIGAFKFRSIVCQNMVFDVVEGVWNFIEEGS